MICRASPWRAFLPLLVLLIAQPWSPYSLSWEEKGSPVERSGSYRMVFQTVQETPAQTSTPTAGRTRRPAPTPTLSIQADHNPGLIIGGVIVMVIILTGLLRFIRHPNP